MKRRFVVLVAAFGMAVLAASFNFGNQASATVPGVNSLVSVNSSGTASGSSGTARSGGAVSADGNYVVFSSPSTNIVNGDTNNHSDIFLRNLSTNSTSIVSISTAGVHGDGDSTSPVISKTGRYIVFNSTATNLIDGTTTTSSYSQLYLRDRSTNTTTLLSQNSSGAIADGFSGVFGVSSDGRFVLLYSSANNLNPAVTDGGYDYYLLDRTTGVFTPLNQKYDGTVPGNTGEMQAAMSCDGSIIAFAFSSQLTSQSTTHWDDYILDLRSGTRLTNLTASSDSAGFNPTVSCDGDHIGLASGASNLDTTVTVTQGRCRGYVYDRINNTFSLIERASDGTVGNTTSICAVSGYYGPTVTINDGNVVVFDSKSTNLTSISTSAEQVYVRNLTTGTTEMLSRNSSGTAANNDTYFPSVSARGLLAAYASNSTNLTSLSDTNSFTDVFTSQTGY